MACSFLEFHTCLLPLFAALDLWLEFWWAYFNAIASFIFSFKKHSVWSITIQEPAYFAWELRLLHAIMGNIISSNLMCHYR
jgi:hypothetical protein